MSRWSHGHSLATGLLLGFALERHTLWLVSAAFLLGVYAGRLLHGAATVARRLRERLEAR